MPQTLHDELATLWRYAAISREVPEFVMENLNPSYPLRPYQTEALARFFYYLSEFPSRPSPTQLLFNMATGSGKTLIMAAAILYLYEKGYRHFLFFVNSTNTIEKTRGNFLDRASGKYLFSDRLRVGGREVRIREVTNFEVAHADDVNVLFTTIQGLHSRLNIPREYGPSFADFDYKDVVLISDEAHHINALTKVKSRLSKSEAEEISTWEGTINKLFASRPGNILLEFTATVDMEHSAIQDKYSDKLVYEYSLKQFREDGYSKEVKVLQADLPPLERALNAIVLSQFRLKVAEKHQIHLKPVLLMKSRTIAESEAFTDEFTKFVDGIDGDDLSKFRESNMSPVVQGAFTYFDEHGISLDNLALELREGFSEERCLSVNSKSESDEKQVLVNSLEDRDNRIRVIFAVDKLNEGWDVLNLFDIVRLYNTRDAKSGEPGRTTMSEAQLIGRGARYFPFALDELQPRDMRKYDGDVGNELRLLEELYYHSAHNPRYIAELHSALVQSGILASRSREITLTVKEAFKNSDYLKNGVIYLNKRVRNERSEIFGFGDASISSRQRYRMQTGYAHETLILEGADVAAAETVTVARHLEDLGIHVIRAAISRVETFKFNHLKTYFPHLKSISEFIESPDYLGSVTVDIMGTRAQTSNPLQDDKLTIATSVLESIAQQIRRGTPDFLGTKKFFPLELSQYVKDKTIRVALREGGDQERGREMSLTPNLDLRLDLSDKDWYVYDESYGTREEKYLIRFVHAAMEKIKERFSDVYLLRNERMFKIFRFSDGAALEPDFVLFLTEHATGASLIYQLFIEPKGQHLLASDLWKEEFLREIEREVELIRFAENKEFKLIGMPFYNEVVTKGAFEERFSELI